MDSKDESLMQWFDRSVEKELKKRRESRLPKLNVVIPPLPKPLPKLKMPKEAAEKVADTATSRVELGTTLRNAMDSELSEAVDKLAKAEAYATFSGAVTAAEEASQNAPPNLIEEFAMAGVREFQTEVTGVQGTVPGERPVEVIGYVGVTKPRYPRMPQ